MAIGHCVINTAAIRRGSRLKHASARCMASRPPAIDGTRNDISSAPRQFVQSEHISLVVTNRSIPRCADFSRKCCSLAGVRSKASMVPGTKPRRTRASCNANVTAPVSQPAFSTLRSERSNRDCSKIARRPCGRASLSHDAGRTLVHEGHRLWTLHVTSLQPIDPKACRRNQLVNRPVEMTAAADSFPDWCQRVLPT